MSKDKGYKPKTENIVKLKKFLKTKNVTIPKK